MDDGPETAYDTIELKGFEDDHGKDEGTPIYSCFRRSGLVLTEFSDLVSIVWEQEKAQRLIQKRITH